MIIKLVRHGQSMSNIGAVSPEEMGDANVELTERGREQAREAGRTVGADFIHDALVYCSPYQRTRQTLAGVLQGAGVERDNVAIYEDPRLREVDPGYENYEAQHEKRRVHGWFYYRFHGGESPADCYDRTSGFLESLMRQAERKRAGQALIVTHGLTIRCFVMRFLHLTVEQFNTIANPKNCDVITIAHKEKIENPLFRSGRWAVSGLRLREGDE